MIGKIKELNFESLLILNTFALVVTSYLFNEFIFIGGLHIIFFYFFINNKEWSRNNQKIKFTSKY